MILFLFSRRSGRIHALRKQSRGSSFKRIQIFLMGGARCKCAVNVATWDVEQFQSLLSFNMKA